MIGHDSNSLDCKSQTSSNDLPGPRGFFTGLNGQCPDGGGQEGSPLLTNMLKPPGAANRRSVEKCDDRYFNSLRGTMKVLSASSTEYDGMQEPTIPSQHLA